MTGELLPAQNQLSGPEAYDAPRSALQDYHDALQACYDLPAQQQEFASIVSDALQATPIAEDREIVKVVAGTLHWQFFGEFGGPLPEGWVQSAGLSIYPDDAVLAPVSYTAGYKAFDNKRIEVLSQKRAKQREAHANRLAPYIEAVIKDSEKYREIQSYAVSDPRQLQDRPLSDEAYRVREAQIEGRARQKFQLPSSASFRLDGAAFKAVNNEKKVLHITSDPTKAAYESPFDILRKEIAKHAPEDLQGRFKGSGDITLHHVGYKDGKLMATFEQMDYAGKNMVHQSPLQILNLATMMGYGGTTKPGREMEEVFLSHVISGAFRPGVDSNDYNAWLESCARAASHDPRMVTRVLGVDELRDNRVTVHLRQTIAPVQEEEIEVEPRLRHSSLAEKVSITSRQEMRERERKVIGHVWYAPHAADRQRRVIESRPRREEFEPFDPSSADIVFTTASESEVFTDAEPFVAGFVLKGYDEHSRAYAFVREPLGDPAVKQRIALPVEGAARLASTYAALGLNKLAEEMGRSPSPTLDDLELLIIKHGKYVFGKDKEQATDIQHLQDLAQFIDRSSGKLLVQCDGSNTSFKLSANLAFGRQVVRTISGYPIEGLSGVVTSMPHRQSIYENEGRMVLYDATPYPNQMMRVIASHFRTKPAGEPYYNRHTPVNIRHQVLEVMEQPVVTAEVKQKAGMLAMKSQAEQFESQLRDQFKAQDFEGLFKKLQGDKAYPILRTLLLMREAGEGNADLAAIATHREFLINIQKATHEERRTWGYTGYETMLGYLISNTQIIYDAAVRH